MEVVEPGLGLLHDLLGRNRELTLTIEALALELS